jgi:dolichol-phosphate mannosyltransferase
MLSIIIPSYNEEARIKNVVLSYAQEFPGQEIIVVCDGDDHTKEIIGPVSSEYPNVKLLGFDGRLGKGRAIIEGFKAAKGDMVGFVDSDESISPRCLKEMFEALKDYDGVIASRRLKESKIHIKQPIRRRLASKGFNLFVRILFGLPFKDTQCGAKVFKRNAIHDIIGQLKTSGFETDVEILWRLMEKGYRIREYPITWKHSDGSKFKLSNSAQMLISLLKIRWSPSASEQNK